MRINYFGYYIINREIGSRILFDLRPFLKSFCKYASPEFKNHFKHIDENIYLFHKIGDMFLFIMTRSNEVIKKINTHKMNLNEIYDLLGQNEQLGFTSYTVVKDCYFSFGSTILAPKYNVFAEFINMILRALKLKNLEICIEPIMHQATKNEVLSMPFIGRTVIEIQKENSIFKDLIEFVEADIQELYEVNSFEIIIKPKRNKNIKKVVSKFIGSTSDDGLQKMIIKAKTEAQGHLSDLYLVSKGAVSDLVNTKDENRLYLLFNRRMSINKVLQSKIGDFKNDERFEKAALEDLSRFNDPNSWSNFVSYI